ncbi:GntR domain protein (plasmid) [Pseudonocardia dioxanivorans CB1190]|uniref:GntR domain protein n=1 Tax=Pseudonocardia dioxanivorans (strain ATCC 55486 / DSM 44775 / JCM 13855 / CB1190) TaxID=675635 RepID=F2L6G9_PSEUX|nr:FCD domain-containing protein [Pseudonocardia dioxanivorans]AEA28863.1 GntR domain protein [Pseudonocardia dioxanivorans CB1190]
MATQDVPDPDPSAKRGSSARAHQLVIDHIEALIRHGSLQRGDRLPGERQLADMLGVSRASVREAVRSLRAIGVLAERTTAGPESGAALASGPSDALTSMLRLHIALSNFTETEVVRTRLMVEQWAAREAAVLASREDIQQLEGVLEEMERPGIDRARFNALDSSFHAGIALTCQNRLLGCLAGALRDAVERHRLDAMQALGPWEQVAADLRAQHREILTFIAAARPEAAAEALHHHLGYMHPAIVDASRRGIPHRGS